MSDWNRNRWAWKKSTALDHRLSLAAKHLATILVDFFANSQTGRCDPGLRTLCEVMDRAERPVQRALAELRACGWIVTHEGGGRGKRLSVIFTTGDGEAPFLGDEKVTDLATRRAERAPKTTRETPSFSTRNPVKNDTPYKDEPKKEPNPPSPQGRCERRRPPAGTGLSAVADRARGRWAAPPPDPTEAQVASGAHAGETGLAETARPPSTTSARHDPAPEPADRRPPLEARRALVAELGLIRRSALPAEGWRASA
jgi:hypothetical protein